MSKPQIIRSVRREIRKLNRIIDYKIIQGLPYRIESRRHKLLVLQLNRLLPPQRSLFGRTLSFATLFML